MTSPSTPRPDRRRGDTVPARWLSALRVTVLVLAVTGSVAIERATDGGAWTVAALWWAVALTPVAVALVVPGPLALATCRTLVPATVPAAVAAILTGDDVVSGAAFLAAALVASALVIAAETAEAMAQGAAYGDERRLPLRCPAAALPALLVSWSAWCALATAGALTMIDRRWVVGGVLAALAAAAGALVVAALHRHGRRWLVLVPAGLVLHDPVVLGETVMTPTRNVRLCRLAPADTEAADLTGPASGHAVEVEVDEMLTIVLAGPAGGRGGRGGAIHARAFLVAPLRPGRALAALAAAGVAVG